MSNINQCPTIFCNCQSIPIPFDNNNPSTNINDYSLLQTISSIIIPSSLPSSYQYPYTQQDNTSIQISYRLYMYVIFIAIFIMFTIQLSMRWFIYKDYYPLKQKSPILTIIMIFSICIQIILYPLIYSINYFTYTFTDPKIRTLFRAIQVGFQFSVYTIYLLRCLRIAYAHQVDQSRRKTIPFKIFQRQWLLAIAIMVIVMLRLASVFIDPCQDGILCNNFAFGFQIAVLNGGQGYNDVQMVFIIRSLIIGFIWQLVLIYCMLLHKNVNYRYSMKKQIYLILAATQVTNLLHIFTLFQTLRQNSTMHYLCNITTIYPMTQFLRLINLLIAFVISIIIPLTKKKMYHILLPTGPHYGFIKTMRNFLMEKQFLRVFSKYLEYLDQQQQTQYYSKLLKFWQQTLIMRLQTKIRPQQQKLQSIITLIQSIQNQNIFNEHMQLINTLKGTINGLQDSFLQSNISSNGNINKKSGMQDSQINAQNQQKINKYKNRHRNSRNSRQQKQSIQQQPNNNNQSFTHQFTEQQKHELSLQLLYKRRQKYRQSINNKVDELQQIALQKLNKIYIQKYYNTQSYIYLKQIMNQYKKVNLNLIMLNMALIVDDYNQFN